MLSTLLILLIASTTYIQAQTVLTGTVYEEGTDLTLPGVNIQVKGTMKGTATDANGEFTLRLEDGQNILIFSYLGFETKEIDVTGLETITVQLTPMIDELDELVVIGYGAVRKRDVTGAVGSLGSEQIGKVSSLNAEQSLTGKVSGVQITTTSGAPGASSAVRIRGVGTFNNSSPIYVVDGVILDDISFLNSSDIESMEVLKDASATAIYGSRGANGVILVQTKSGSGNAEDGVKVNVSLESGLQQLERQIDLLNGRQFAIIANEIRSGSYNNVDAVPNTNWQDLIFNVAPMQNHQISLSGGSEKGDYYVSFGYFQQEGIIDKSNYERFNLKLNNTYKLSQNVKIGNNITIAPYNQQVAPGVTFAVYRAQPVLEPYYDDGSFGVVYNVGNPLASLNYSNNYNKGVRVVGNVFAEAIVKDALLLKTSFGTDASFNKATNFTPAYTIYNPDGTASQQDNEFSDLFKGQSYNMTWIWENTVNYIQDFDKHSVNAVGGITLQQTRSEYLNVAGQNIIRDGEDFWYVLPEYVVDEANNINMVSSINNGVNAAGYYNMVSFLGRLVYSYDDRYTFTATTRYDGSSKFAQGKQWGLFPSFAFGWNIEEEDFMQDVELFDQLKLRASWGKIGNEKINYSNRFSLVTSANAVFGIPDALYNGLTYGKSGNENLKWETTSQTDIGLELRMFESRFTAEFDYYNRETNDILVDLSTPGHLGNGQGQKITYNAAVVLNEGFEFNLGWEDQLGEVGYSLNAVGNTVHNEVKAIGGNSGIDSVLVGGYLANGQAVTRSEVGRPIGAFYGYVTDGIFQNQAELDAYPHLSQAGIGDLRFKDVNGDGVINGDDRTYIGSPIPDFVYGFSMDLNWKNFDMSIGFQGQIGNEIFNGKNVVRPDPYNFEAHVWDRWTGEGTSNSEPRPSYGGYNFLPSDRFIHDGSYLRLRSLIIGYRLPEKILTKMNLDNARFYLKANNLFTFTEYPGYTPEIGSNNVLANGIDTGIYPIPRVISIGFNTTF
tara:strand:+ start:28658 stop:31669 length:3012 start_codon:yes stop_codon:yes gene_type:complete